MSVIFGLTFLVILGGMYLLLGMLHGRMKKSIDDEKYHFITCDIPGKITKNFTLRLRWVNVRAPDGGVLCDSSEVGQCEGAGRQGTL